MADEESQVEEDTSWWAIEAFPDVELPSMSLDEPLEWPDSLPWEEFSSGVPSAPLPGEPADLVFPVDAPEAAIDPGPTPDPHVEWQAGGYDPDDTMAATPLAGLGGGAAHAAAANPATEVQPLPDSIWSLDSEEPQRDDSVAGLASLHAPLAYADTDGPGRVQGLRRFDVSRGNVAIVALISAVSLVLLGMFLSVRSRNDVPTDATASPPRTDQIATANTRNSLPVTTTALTTTVPGPSINIADLVAPADAGSGGTAGAAGGGTGTTARTPVATTAPARATAPAGGGGGSTGTTQPALQSTATTAAPEPPPDTTPPATSPPADDTTNTTTRPRTTTPMPTFPTPTVPDVTVPSGGGSFPNFPGVTFPRNDD